MAQPANVFRLVPVAESDANSAAEEGEAELFDCPMFQNYQVRARARGRFNLVTQLSGLNHFFPEKRRRQLRHESRAADPRIAGDMGASRRRTPLAGAQNLEI